VLASVRALNRIELAGEVMRHALNRPAILAPDWVRMLSQPAWVDRYARRAEDPRLPMGQQAREALALTMGADGARLLNAAYSPGAPTWLREVPAVQTPRRVWVQNSYREGEHLRWRTEIHGIPASADFISSPYDLDAHYARKRSIQWVGYKIHAMEICEEDLPCLITEVEGTSGPVVDGAATPAIPARLQDKGLLPGVHLVDTGYLDGPLMAESRPDYKWQAKAGDGFDAAHFAIDWERTQATCPRGKISSSWMPAIGRQKNEVIKVMFSSKDCGPCPSRAHCCRSTKQYPRRTITLRPKDANAALQADRARDNTAEFPALYAKRAGVEGTFSRGIRRCRLCRTRYVGAARVLLGHVFIAVAINFLHLGEWFTQVPRAKTRYSAYMRLMAKASVA
jgi:transposase